MNQQSQVQVTAEAETVKAFIVYRKTDGKIVHRHQIHVLSGTKKPSEEAMVEEVKALAGRIAGASEAEIGVLPVTVDELERSFELQVDIQAQRLVGRSAPR